MTKFDIGFLTATAIFVFLLVFFWAKEMDALESKCHQKSGVVIKSSGGYVCVDKAVLK